MKCLLASIVFGLCACGTADLSEQTPDAAHLTDTPGTTPLDTPFNEDRFETLGDAASCFDTPKDDAALDLPSPPADTHTDSGEDSAIEDATTPDDLLEALPLTDTDDPLQGQSCDDADPCTRDDQWKGGICRGARYACDDHVTCTVDQCDGQGGCEFTPDEGWCLIEDRCFGRYELQPGDDAWLCDPDLEPHAWSARPLDGPCDDGNAFTGDGCGPNHQVETGWACSPFSGACMPLCGDGLVMGIEACDDGNGTLADGCGPACITEEGARCWGSPSSCVPGPCPGMTITYRGNRFLGDTAAGPAGEAVPLTGMSGIARETDSDFLVIMDNSNRIARIRLTWSATGAITSAAFLNGVLLAHAHDFEGIALPAPSDAPQLILAEENTPALRRYHIEDGTAMGTLSLPEVFATRRDNYGLESLASDPRDHALWTANEEGLPGDAPLSTPQDGTTVRLLRLVNVGDTWQAMAQFAYLVDPMHGANSSSARSGVSDLLVLPGGRLLVLERSAAISLSGIFETRLYEVIIADADDVSSVPRLLDVAIETVSKRLLWSGHLANIEGVTLGPSLGSGHWALVGVVDDGDPLSTNALASFELVIPDHCLPH